MHPPHHLANASEGGYHAARISRAREVEQLLEASRPRKSCGLIEHLRYLSVVIEASVRPAVLVHEPPGVPHDLRVTRHGVALDEDHLPEFQTEVVVVDRACPLPFDDQGHVGEEVDALAPAADAWR